MVVNYKKFKFGQPSLHRESSSNGGIYLTDRYYLDGFKNLSITFKIHLNGRLAEG